MRLYLKQKVDYYLGNFLILLLRPFVFGLGCVLKRDHNLDARKDLTILKLLGGGSLMFAFPSMLSFKRRYPDTRLRIVTTQSVAPFARTMHIFDDIYVIDDSSIPKLLWTGLKSLWSVRRTDTIIDFEVYSRLSTVFSLFTMARNRIGFYVEAVFWRRFIQTHLVYFNQSSPSYLFYDKVFELYGVEPTPENECRNQIIANLAVGIEKKARRICVGHACSELGKERMLALEDWEKVFGGRLNKDSDVEVYFLGSKNDRASASRIVEKLKAQYPNIGFVNYCGETSLDASLGVLAEADAFWGIDSALLHYARLFRVPCVSFWGPTDPTTRLRPMQGLEEQVHYKKIPCSPCVHVTENPPCQGNNVCIKNLFTEGEPKEWIGLLK